MELSDKSQLIKYLKQNELWAKKSLGQNFLVDQGVLNKIIEAAELKKSDTVIEIGPGLGILTQELVLRAGRVIAIEKDEKLVNLLELRMANHVSGNEIKIIRGDALKISETQYLPVSSEAEGIPDTKYKLVANIPYYITSKVLEKFLSVENKPELIVLLVQKEVAERICAKPGQMSVMSVAVQLYSQPEIIAIVKATSFFPEPKVDSAIIKIKLKARSYKLEAIGKELFKTVKAGFHARRKTLVNNLMVGTNLDKIQIIDILKKIGLSEKVRAQELSVDQWIKLSKMLE